MNAIFLVLFSVISFIIAYATYGRYLAKKWGIDPSKETPAHRLNDGVDYVPAKAPVLLGHHFSSIAGAAPIIGPIAAAIFGWLPVLLWIVLGSIFFGGVHDMGSLLASVRHDGKSVGEVIGDNIGEKGKKLFSIFAWLTLILVIAAFANVVANTFAATPSAATASILFIALAVAFGILVYRRGASLLVGTIIGVALLILSIYLGLKFPLSLSKNVWMVLLLSYIFVASVTPVWILLQPRDYLNSFLLYGMLIGGFVGIMIMGPKIQAPAVTGFNINGTYLFPMLFVTVACGAVSGFHSLVASGTTAKQIDTEKDVQLVGYGSMLIEGVLATLAIISATYIGADKLTSLLGSGGPVNVFAEGIGTFMTSFGLPFATGKSFTALAISAFALTTLDTATRLARFIFQEMVVSETKETVLTNRFVSTGITVVIAGALAFRGWLAIWPLFGSANQLLAAIALLTITIWMKNNGKEYRMALYPMFFLFAVTLTVLALLIMANLTNYVLLFFGIALFVLALILMSHARKAFVAGKPLE
jgi:carbon starvation protein